MGSEGGKERRSSLSNRRAQVEGVKWQPSCLSGCRQLYRTAGHNTTVPSNDQFMRNFTASSQTREPDVSAPGPSRRDWTRPPKGVTPRKAYLLF